jgi:release factor glutamine methyltransferase
VTTVAAALAQAHGRGVARLDAQLMLARLLALSRTALIAHDDRALTRDESERWAAWLARRAGGEPLAYVLGEKEFCGLMLEVDRNVLVPRPETELLVEWVSALLADRSSTLARAPAAAPPRVVDLGTGSGAIALAVKSANPLAAVTATDVSAASLAVARRNAARLGLAIETIETSWWDGLARRRFEIAVANPPYVAAGDPHLEALRHEPLAALTAGDDGLAALKTIVAAAPSHLEPGGWLVLEHGCDQASAVRGLLAHAGFLAVETRRDLAGLERATGGRRGAA